MERVAYLGCCTAQRVSERECFELGLRRAKHGVEVLPGHEGFMDRTLIILLAAIVLIAPSRLVGFNPVTTWLAAYGTVIILFEILMTFPCYLRYLAEWQKARRAVKAETDRLLFLLSKPRELEAIVQLAIEQDFFTQRNLLALKLLKRRATRLFRTGVITEEHLRSAAYFHDVGHGFFPPIAKIATPPGVRLWKLAEFFCTQRTYKAVFEPLLADFQHEYFEALSQGRRGKALWLRVLYLWAFCKSTGLNLAMSFVREIWRLL